VQIIRLALHFRTVVATENYESKVLPFLKRVTVAKLGLLDNGKLTANYIRSLCVVLLTYASPYASMRTIRFFVGTGSDPSRLGRLRSAATQHRMGSSTSDAFQHHRRKSYPKYSADFLQYL
jgi:hypothetical protein